MILSRDFWRDVATPDLLADPQALSADALRIYNYLAQYGASFLGEIHASGKFFSEQTERGIRELIARGMVTSDQFFSLRRLFATRRGRFMSPFPAGRFALLAAPKQPDETRRHRAIAEMLLRRQGVVFRYAAELDFFRIAWPDLVRELRRMEMAGLIHSGRFIDLLWGEQFAEPRAIPLLSSDIKHMSKEEKFSGDPVGITRALLLRLGVIAREHKIARLAPQH